MKNQWLGYAAIIILAISMAACEGAGSVSGLGKLPPPREPLADTPDLKNARFEITDRSIDLMRGDGVSSDVLGKLEGLKGNVYKNAAEFNKAVAEAIGSGDLGSNRESIMQHSTHVALLVEPPFPGAELKGMAAQPEGAIGTVFFDFDKSDIKPEFAAEIEGHAKQLVDNPDMRVRIEGHCDERGTTEYNLALGERRANAVKDALVANGADPGQLETVSFGEERPAAMGSNEDAWSQNRRGVLVQL